MKKGTTNFWMIGFFVLLGVLLFMAGTFFPNLLLKKPMVLPSPTPKEKTNVSQPQPTITSSERITPNPTVEERPIIDQLKQALATKYGKTVDQVELSVNKNTGTHASGGVRFTGEISGAMWLAYKGSEGWILVHDGHGTIPCETISAYDFPADIVTECVDSSGNLITR